MCIRDRCEVGENSKIAAKKYLSPLYLYTKMRNVGGIAQTEAQKSSDLFMKCRYLDEITGGRGVVSVSYTHLRALCLRSVRTPTITASWTARTS